MSSKSTESNKSTDFSASTKRKIEQQLENCWACEKIPVEFADHAHVIPKADNIKYLRSLGISDPEALISSYCNGVLLCPLCHSLYDKDTNPGWVFFPADLDYFIDFEIKDRASRSASPRPRHFPTSDMYLEHQKNKGAVAPDAEQPMFVRYALSPEGLAGPVDGERGWHGHPIAPIRNSWRALGAIRGDAIPRGYRQQLLYLLELYRTPVDQQVSPPHSPPPSLPPGPDDEDNDKDKGKRREGQPGPKRRIPKSVESTLASKRQRRESTVGGGTKVVAVAKWLDAVEDPVHTAPSSPVSLRGKMGLQV